MDASPPELARLIARAQRDPEHRLGDFVGFKSEVPALLRGTA